MSWLLELLVDAIREMCSQFIVDMMELITNMFTELLSCNLSLFEELFSVVGSLYKNVIVPTGIAILLMILVWQLFKSMFGGKAGVNAEEPIELICRSAISLFLLAGSKPLVDYILRIAGTPYQWVVGTKVKVASFSGYVSTLEGVTDAAYHWGLTCERVGKDRMNYVVQSLKEGKMVVEICEAYTITGSGSGHFIVLTGVTRDGYITIADCASRERTGKVYSVETIKSYGRDLSEGAFWIVGKK